MKAISYGRFFHTENKRQEAAKTGEFHFRFIKVKINRISRGVRSGE